MLLAYGARTGLFRHGTDLDNILAMARQTADRRIAWVDEDIPLFLAYGDKVKINFEDLSGLESLSTDVYRERFKQMCFAAGLNADVALHAARYGHIRDLTRLPSNKFSYPTLGGAHSAGHSAATFHSGTSAMYAGDDLYHANVDIAARPAETTAASLTQFSKPRQPIPRTTDKQVSDFLADHPKEASESRNPQEWARQRLSKTTRQDIREEDTRLMSVPQDAALQAQPASSRPPLPVSSMASAPIPPRPSSKKPSSPPAPQPCILDDQVPR